MLNIFLAHPKSTPVAEIERLRECLHRACEAENFKEEWQIISGREDFEQYAPGAGGFQGWCRDVVERADSSTGRPFYKCIVVTSELVGKATGEIVSVALERGMPVLILEEFEDADGSQVSIREVTGVRCVNARDFQTGWAIKVAS